MTRRAFAPAVDRHKIKGLPQVSVGETQAGFVEVKRFLKHHGYLAEDAPETDEFDAVTSEALATLQERYSVGTPGAFDEATRDFMSEPWCGVKDSRGLVAFATTCSWPYRNFKFAFDFLSLQGPNQLQLPNQVVRDAIRRAFATWEATGVGLTYNPAQFPEDHHIRMASRPLSVGAAESFFPPPCSGHPPPLPINFDQEEWWADGKALDAMDIESVALHEIGHTLGLDNSNVLGSVMYPTIRPNFTRRTLTSDDRAGLQALYPSTYARSQTVVRNADGRLEVFTIGLNRMLWNMWQVAGTPEWSRWNPLNGAVKQMVPALNQDGHLEVLAIGGNDALFYIWQTVPGQPWWDPWVEIGGSCEADCRRPEPGRPP